MVGTPWEPAENLNRVAPAGVSLVVTGCSQGPVGPLNSAGEKLSPGISHSASAFSHSAIRVFTWISIDFLLLNVFATTGSTNLCISVIDFDSAPHRNSWKGTNGQFSSWILKDVKSWLGHLLSYHYVQYF